MKRPFKSWGQQRAEETALADYAKHLGTVHEAGSLTDDDGGDYGAGFVKVLHTPRKLILSWNLERTELLPTWNVKPVQGTPASVTQELRPVLRPTDFEDEE